MRPGIVPLEEPDRPAIFIFSSPSSKKGNYTHKRNASSSDSSSQSRQVMRGTDVSAEP